MLETKLDTHGADVDAAFAALAEANLQKLDLVVAQLDERGVKNRFLVHSSQGGDPVRVRVVSVTAFTAKKGQPTQAHSLGFRSASVQPGTTDLELHVTWAARKAKKLEIVVAKVVGHPVLGPVTLTGSTLVHDVKLHWVSDRDRDRDRDHDDDDD